MSGIRLAAFGVAAALAIAAAIPPTIPPNQGHGDPAPVLAAQREAMKKLAALDGQWRGPAWTILPNGEKHELTQTERVGPFLDGAVRVVEGRGYQADGTTGFNAFAVFSYDVGKKAYSMRSYAQGRVGDFVLEPTENGFMWKIPAGPMTIQYTAVIDGDEWSEVGEQITPGKEPFRFFEMKLKRVGDTQWPAGDAVPAK